MVNSLQLVSERGSVGGTVKRPYGPPAGGSGGFRPPAPANDNFRLPTPANDNFRVPPRQWAPRAIVRRTLPPVMRGASLFRVTPFGFAAGFVGDLLVEYLSQQIPIRGPVPASHDKWNAMGWDTRSQCSPRGPTGILRFPSSLYCGPYNGEGFEGEGVEVVGPIFGNYQFYASHFQKNAPVVYPDEWRFNIQYRYFDVKQSPDIPPYPGNEPALLGPRKLVYGRVDPASWFPEAVSPMAFRSPASGRASWAMEAQRPARSAWTSGEPSVQPAPAQWRYPRPVRRPPKKDKKLRLTVQGTAVGFAFNTVTESTDIINSLHDALPYKYQHKRPDPQGKVLAIQRHWQHMDWGLALQNLIANQVEDYIFGKIGKISARANAVADLRIQFGPAL